MIAETTKIHGLKYCQMRSKIIYLKPYCFKWLSLAFFVQLFLIIFSYQTLKWAINKVNVNIINQGTINTVSNLYHTPPPPPPSSPPPPTPMRTEIKIITSAVTFRTVQETNKMVLTVIPVQFFWQKYFYNGNMDLGFTSQTAPTMTAACARNADFQSHVPQNSAKGVVLGRKGVEGKGRRGGGSGYPDGAGVAKYRGGEDWGERLSGGGGALAPCPRSNYTLTNRD